MTATEKIKSMRKIREALDDVNTCIDELIAAQIDHLDRELQKQVKDTIIQARAEKRRLRNPG